MVTEFDKVDDVGVEFVRIFAEMKMTRVIDDQHADASIFRAEDIEERVARIHCGGGIVAVP